MIKTSLFKVAIILLLSFFATQAALAEAMYYYKDLNGKAYRICRDWGGFIVYKPDGDYDIYSFLDSWAYVTSQYGIRKYYKKSSEKSKDCDLARSAAAKRDELQAR